MDSTEMKPYSIAKYTYYEIFIDSQIQSAGAHQAKLMEKLKKSNRYVKSTTIAMKVIFGFVFAFLPFVALIAYFEIVDGLADPQLAISVIFFVSSLSFSAFFGIMVLYLLLFGLFTTSAFTSGNAFKWLQSLPISKKKLQTVGIMTVFRSVNVPIIINLIALPVIMLIGTGNVFIFLVCLVSSITNTIFSFSVLVIIGERLGRIFNQASVNSKKASIMRLLTMIGYFLIAFGTGIAFSAVFQAISIFFDLFKNVQELSILNFIFSFIPYPFAPAYLISMTILPNYVPPYLIISSLVGFGLFLLLLRKVYSVALGTLKNTTSSEIVVRGERELVSEEEISKTVEIEVKTPIKSYLKKDLTSATRDYQSFMFFIMPIIWPAIMMISMSYPIVNEVTSDFAMMILWGIVLVLSVFTPMMLVVGLLNLEQSGESALASLPVLPRDQAKAKILLMSIIQTIAFIIVSIEVSFLIANPLFLLLYLSSLPIAWLFLFVILGLKVRLFGKLKYKYVLEEVNRESRLSKWLIILFGGMGLYLVILMVGFVVFSLTNIYVTSFVIFGVGILGLGCVIYMFNKMFPKLEKMATYRTGGALREHPILGIIVLLAIYFGWSFIPLFVELLFIVPFIQNFSYTAVLFVEFFLSFGFLAILWLVVVPKALKLPKITQSISEHFKAIGLSQVKPLGKNILIGVVSTAIFCLIVWLGAITLGEYIFDLNVLFGNPDPNIPGFLGLGWFLFVFMLIPGIWEEVSFRGVMIPMLEKKFSVKKAIIISSVFFGLFHGTNAIFLLLANINPISVLFQMVYATFLGISFGYMYTKTRSLLPSMIYHYLLDAVGQLFLYVIFYDIILGAIFTIVFVGILPCIIVCIFVKITTDFKSSNKSPIQEIRVETEIVK